MEKLTTEGPSGTTSCISCTALRETLSHFLDPRPLVRFDALDVTHAYVIDSDPMFLSLFLLVFRSFTTSAELFSQLVKRFDVQPPGDLKTADQIATFKKTQMQVRVRVCNVFKNWLQNHFYDFDKVRCRPTEAVLKS